MNGAESIYISRRECVACWRCVRECPVKAISAGAESAAIVQDRCTGCGKCLSVCRFGAVKLREDIYTARELIKASSVKVASVTPQWLVEMEGMSEGKFIEALKLLGFDHVCEAALAADTILGHEQREKSGTVISSRCPAVVSWISKYSPRHADILSVCATPMEVHARMIKRWWGEETRVVHFTACPAAKGEAGRGQSAVDVVVTFKELKQWLREEGIAAGNLVGGKEHRFGPQPAGQGLLYNLCGEQGNILPGKAAYSASPLARVEEAMKSFRLETGKDIWLDFMACPGGCTGSGASAIKALSPVIRAVNLREMARARAQENGNYKTPPVDLSRRGEPGPLPDRFVAESDTLLALEKLGMNTRAAQTDCNACGFGTCRRFAKALSRGEVPREMCWFYLREEVTTRLTTLLSKLSSGVAIVDSSMRIGQANRLFATMMGPTVEALFDSAPGLKDRPARDIMPFYGMVSSLLESGEESVVRDVQIGERLITVSVHTVQKYRSAIVICRNMIFSQVRNEEIVKRTQRVIDENLETVRKIASLLGENASRTEAILNSILEAHTRENE